MTADAAPPPAPGIADEIMRRHAGKPGAESRALVGVLSAVLDAVRSRGLDPSPSALFAALMAALDGPRALDEPQALSAMAHLLDLVLVRVPAPVLRTRFSETARVLMAVVEAANGNPPALRHTATCLATLMASAATDPAAASTPAAWAPLAPPWAALLNLCLTPNPKARRAAGAGAVAALAAFRAGARASGSTALASAASDAIVRVAAGVLPGPAAAAAAAARATGAATRAAADEAVGRAAADALHALGLLRGALPLLVPAAAGVREVAVPAILPLFGLRNPLLARHAADAVRALLAAPPGEAGGGAGARVHARKAPASAAAAFDLPAADVAALISAFIATPGAWDGRDADALAAAAAALDAGLRRLAALDPPAAAAALPPAAAALAPLISSESEGVRVAAAMALRSALASAGGVTSAAATRGGGGCASAGAAAAPPPAVQLAATLVSALGPGARPGWAAALPAAADTFTAAAAAGPPSPATVAALAPLLARLGALCAGAADAAEADPGAPPPDFAGPASAALGAAIAALGPEVVLDVLPLGLGPALDGVRGAPDPRAWLLPALRAHTRGARLGFWGTSLLPLARDMGSRSATAAAVGDRVRSLQTRALEMQLWQALPAFASYAVDGGDALRTHARDIARAFTARPDLRPSICAALVRLCDQCAPSEAARFGGGLSESEDEEAGGGRTHAHPPPPQFTPAVVAATKAALASQAKNWLPLLLNTLVSAGPGERGPLSAAIGAYARAAAPAPLVRDHFGAALAQLAAATRDAANPDQGSLTPTTASQGGDCPATRRVTFMDATLALAPGLPVEDVTALAAAAAPGLTDRSPAVQKRAYKLLATMCAGRPDFLAVEGGDAAGLGGVLATLLAAGPRALPAAKRHRLAVVREAVLALRTRAGPQAASGQEEDGGADANAGATLIAEAVLATKEANHKTRTAAYALLVDLGSPGADPPGSPPGTGLRELFAVVLGGLAGGSPHMVSASTMAAARLVHAFVPGPLGPDAGRLLPAILPLLRTPAREVIKSVLGFIKVCVGRLPSSDLEAATPDLLDGLLRWSDDPKNKFRLKVRVIVERLARRIGFEAVAASMPASDAKLLAHIRKQGARKARKKAAGAEEDAWSDGEGEEEGDAAGDRRTVRTGRTSGGGGGAPSEWAPTALFSAKTGRTGFTKAGKGATTVHGSARAGGGAALPGDRAGADPVDLLGGGAARALAGGRAPAGGRGGAGGGGAGGASRRRGGPGDGGDDSDADFQEGDDGRLLISEPKPKGAAAAATRNPKRGRRVESDEDDDDSDSGGGGGGGGFGRHARSEGGRSAPKSVGGRSAKSAGGRSAATAAGGTPGGRAHTGARFRAAKGGAQGDVTRAGAKTEPYAYWPMDRSMLNRRPSKQVTAAQGLHGIVSARDAAKGTGGRAAKRMRRGA